jgi:hypothetical protein
MSGNEYKTPRGVAPEPPQGGFVRVAQHFNAAQR